MLSTFGFIKHVDPASLTSYLDAHAASLSRTTLS
jgi:hypothetical protein